MAVNINWIEKVLIMKCYETSTLNGVNVHQWANDMEESKLPDESLIFMATNSSEVVLHEIGVSYSQHELLYMHEPVSSEFKILT